MRLWRIHSGGEKNAKNNEIVKRQQQQQAAANIPRVFVWKNQPKKGKKNVQRGPGGAGTSTWYISREGYIRQQNTNKLEAGPAAKGRDNEGQMRRSHASSV